MRAKLSRNIRSSSTITNLAMMPICSHMPAREKSVPPVLASSVEKSMNSMTGCLLSGRGRP
jgi:hypothetical protein